MNNLERQWSWIHQRANCYWHSCHCTQVRRYHSIDVVRTCVEGMRHYWGILWDWKGYMHCWKWWSRRFDSLWTQLARELICKHVCGSTPCSHDPHHSLDPTKYGYAKEEETKSLIPVTVLTNVQLAPDNILRLIRCTCASGSLCKSSRCQCNKAKLACTIFCGFRAPVECYNDQTKAANDSHWKVTMFGHFGWIFWVDINSLVREEPFHDRFI